MRSESPTPLPGWLAPVLVAAVAIPTSVAFWIGGRPELGAVWAGVNVAFALVIALGRRSDTIRLLSGTEDVGIVLAAAGRGGAPDCARGAQPEELSSVSTVGSSLRSGGRTSRQVH